MFIVLATIESILLLISKVVFEYEPNAILLSIVKVSFRMVLGFFFPF